MNEGALGGGDVVVKVVLGIADFPLLLLEELTNKLRPYNCVIRQDGFDIEVYYEGSSHACDEVIAIVRYYDFHCKDS